MAPNSAGLNTPGRNEFDLGDPSSLKEKLEKMSPARIINCGSYTNVDLAESEIAIAHSVNADAPQILAEYAARNDVPLIHISTDFVFDGKKSIPYLPSDKTNPLNVYGMSKLDGEQAILEANPDACVIRTSWIHSEYGNNFALKILDLASRHDEISVVTDQIGSPCYARNLAVAIWHILESWPVGGLYHFADSGETSRRDFAIAIIEEGAKANILERQIPVKGVTSEHFPYPAQRPAYSALDSSLLSTRAGLELTTWECGLHDMIQRLASKRG
jgi:dTDP-4-dehydrorhamnose reductase